MDRNITTLCKTLYIINLEHLTSINFYSRLALFS